MLKTKSSATETVACADDHLTSSFREDSDKICQNATRPHSPRGHLPATPLLTTASILLPPKSHLIDNICFQGSSPLPLLHLCLGYHSNYPQSSVIPSLYISVLSHDWLPASTLIIAGGNTQKVAASCFLWQAPKLPARFTFPPTT